MLTINDTEARKNWSEVIDLTAKTFEEEDGSITISLCEMDLVENGENLDAAKFKLATAILEYAEEFYADFDYWGSAPNRSKHIPYVFKALIINDSKKIGDLINCQIGKI